MQTVVDNKNDVNDYNRYDISMIPNGFLENNEFFFDIEVGDTFQDLVTSIDLFDEDELFSHIIFMYL